ncbi:hypothetical protein O181_033231 [Austropuccinia psidii MF-1]|uniref:Ras modification protein ERF4 n=1 Tax=Austropuccinia psidii MF-1 TaxID=1389203 RepID=A0A9Q3CYC3_9BASI|nr:hypothetical protein [Austropuccinia psidii MF-1]
MISHQLQQASRSEPLISSSFHHHDLTKRNLLVKSNSFQTQPKDAELGNGLVTANRNPRIGQTRNQSSIGQEEDINIIEPDKTIFGTPPAGVVGQSKPRATVRIERDYSARGSTSGRIQFWDGWLQELEGRVTPLDFQNTLNDLNAILASAYDPYSSIFDNALAILTLYLSNWLFRSHYEKKMKLFEETLQHYNQTIYNPAGLNLLHPRKVAFLFLQIEYY